MEENKEFTAINTEEEFQAATADLRNKIEQLTGERDGHAATITELQNKIKGYEMAELRASVAKAKGIPADMIDRIRGETEEEMNADAEVLLGIVRGIKGPAPLFDNNPKAEDAKNASLKKLLANLKGE